MTPEQQAEKLLPCRPWCLYDSVLGITRHDTRCQARYCRPGVAAALAEKDVEIARIKEIEFPKRIESVTAALRAEIERLKRGEYICQKCGLRKDAESGPSSF